MKTYRCAGYASYHGPCGAYDCDSCYPGGGEDQDEVEEEEVSTVKVVTCRKARYGGTEREIRPGDTATRYSGFTYFPGGPRKYFHSYTRISKGPAWPAEDLSADIGF